MPEAQARKAARQGAGWFALSAALAAVLFGYVVSRPLDWLLQVVPDDAFYYLQIARHIAHTGASTFDGINPTNGYHPAWMAVIVICSKLWADPLTLLRTCLLSAFVFHLAGAFTLARALRAWLPATLAWIGGCLWLLNPLPLKLASLGMEASIYVFALSVALLACAGGLEPRGEGGTRPPSFPRLVLFGLSLSLCFWGRTEAVTLAAIGLVALAFSLRRVPGWFTCTLTAGGAFVAGIVPWLLYSYWATGTLVQKSGAMKMLWASTRTATAGHRAKDAVRVLIEGWLSYPLVESAPSRWLRDGATVALTAGLVLILIRGRKIPQLRRQALLGGLLLFATLSTGAVYALFFVGTQFWYKAQAGFILFVLIYVAVALLAQRRWPAVAIGRGALGAALLSLVVSAGQISHLGIYPWQKDVYASQKDFDQIVPAGARIGCFNAGIPAYFSSRTIVNLDGLVNNTVYPYYRDHRFDAYLNDAHIGYIADEIDSLNRARAFARGAIDLEEVARSPFPQWLMSSTRYLWRVKTAK